MAFTGYQGFRSESTKYPPALKPGETLVSRAKKYNELTDGFEGSVGTVLRDATVSQMASATLRAADYRVPDKRGISSKFEAQAFATKPLNGLTMHRSSYTGFDASQCALKVKPEWWSKSQQATETVRAPTTKSSYQMDLGMEGEFPSARPYTAKTSMAGTTMDLCAGTTKMTYQIPGYSGYIPNSDRNAEAVSQADGSAARQPVSSLRLYHRHNLPGYAGHNPANALNDKGPRYSGASVLTSSGTRGEVL
ncbi:hypothetical protein M885DRAFT_543999 [Pelagophyceae sp. CCMP2097]|nr:hypothetical protein M885DRAFT_543999 [Pelagophyceae sp. CCMP2097]